MEITAHEGAQRLAAHLGLTTTGVDLIPPHKYEMATEELRTLMKDVTPPSDQEDNNKPVMSAFCTKFIPSLVTAYKQAPRTESPYALMLWWTTRNNYFAKLMRSPWGSDLYLINVNQLVSHATSERKRKTSPATPLITLHALILTSGQQC
ncbi:hypothetical protein C8R43DRAFT_1013851 [Mycena crocata]|nr:hypothetical protein C8R43DRAFT_1013851 [Mycena crocata]